MSAWPSLCARVVAFGFCTNLLSPPTPCSHNAEFANAICTETWLIDQGRINISGESWTQDVKLKEREQLEEVVDAAGNVIKVTQKPKELTKAEKKKIIKARLIAIKKGEEVDDEEPWMAEFLGNVE